MPSQQTQPARGMRDFLPDDVRRREYVIGVVRGVYERYGFEPLETPAFENIETLLGQVRRRGQQADLQDPEARRARGDAARPTSRCATTSPCRSRASSREYQSELPKFFKRYQIQPVWRADRPASGRFREFYQCDVDAIGSTSPVVEAELLRRGQRRAARARVHATSSIRLNHRARADGAARRPRACRRRCTATRSSRSTSWTRSAPTASRRSSRRAASTRRGGDAVRRRSSPARAATARDAALRRVRGTSLRRRTTAVANARRDRAALRGDERRGARASGRSEPGARAVVLHRRDHGNRGARSGRQPRRRRPLRQPGRHVPRARRAGLRVLARPRADPRRDGRARMFPPAVAGGAVDVMVTLLDDESRAEALRAGGGAARRRPARRASIPEAGQARQAVQVRVGARRAVRRRSSATTSARAARSAIKNLQTRRAAVDRRARAGRGRRSSQPNSNPDTVRTCEPRTQNSSMAEPLGTLARTHTCGALRADDVGTDVVLLGWVHRVRDLGGAAVHRPPRPRTA